MKVLGIDPGSRHFGYGIIDSSSMSVITAGTINLKSNQTLAERLEVTFRLMMDIVEKFAPDEMAVEKIFVGKKIPSSFILGYMRAVPVLIAGIKKIPIYEYNSTEIKKAITGYGKAHKIQIKKMVNHFLNLNAKISYDCADALAIALCHINSKLLKLLK